MKVGSETKNDLHFVGQHVKWCEAKGSDPPYIEVDQNKAIEELTEIVFAKALPDNKECDPQMHTAYRSVVGQINWLQSKTQFHVCFKFSRSASALAKPTIADVKALNKLVRSLRAQFATLKFWSLRGPSRLVAIPDAAYRNNPDKSSQRGHVIFMAEPRERSSHTYGSLVDFESHKINRTTLSTTVAELYACMKCFGMCQFLRGLWKDLTGMDAEIHLRTDANNLVTTATSTHDSNVATGSVFWCSP